MECLEELECVYNRFNNLWVYVVQVCRKDLLVYTVNLPGQAFEAKFIE